MENNLNGVSGANGDESRESAQFLPRIDTSRVLYEMMRTEAREGRLTMSRQRRFIRYAAEFGLSHREIAELMSNAIRDAVADGGGHLPEQTESPSDACPVELAAIDHRQRWSLQAVLSVVIGAILLILAI